MELIYNARDERYKSPYGAVEAGQEITFCLRPSREIGVLGSELFIAEDGNDYEQHKIKLQWTKIEGDLDCYTGTYTVPRAGLYWYYFRVLTRAGVFYISRGYGSKGEAGAELADRFQLTAYEGSYQVPAWFGEGITYNIFPDRFRRHHVPEETGYRAARVIHKNWTDTPEYRPDKRGEILNNDFFGGSLRGIIEKLPYLSSLHVKTIYLNPIFEAFSNHRYDTGDYMKIDPMLGTEEDFKQLCKRAAQYGMRVILDGVFNHTGFDSRYFNGRGNYEELGAYQSQESKYYSWYQFARWPDKYDSWWGIYTLPHVRETDPGYQDFIYRAKDSVIRHWLHLGASGWRLDVADELPDEFIQDLNSAAKEEKPDALIMGEVWEDASNKIAYDVRRKYFQGGELDSVMNYPLRDAILAFLGGDTAQHFKEQIETLRENYPADVFYSLMNIIGTHDTPRILTIFGENPSSWKQDRDYRAQAVLSPEALASAKVKMKMAVVMQFTLPGSPCIYYGDEVGMQGFEDPFNRRTFPWGNEDEETLAFYLTLCTLREESAAMQKGTLAFLHADGGVLAFQRELADEKIVIIINRTDEEARLDLHTDAAFDLLNGQVANADEETGQTRVRVLPESAAIFRCHG